MPVRYNISKEQIAELKKARKINKNKKVDKRLLALLLHAEGKKRAEIAEKTEFGKTYISKLVSKYCSNGLSAIVENRYSGNHRNMSFAEEAEFLEPFRKAAEAGQFVEVSEIKQAYEERLGRSFENHNGQIYYVLHRHGWRKVKPRSKHPNKASDEEIESSKKLTQLSEESNWKILTQEGSD
jgi:transposase